ncbi:hypothetical protein KEM54_005305 [Ascosphaera aggregata]|nr:hypothetical protein KEM54_005305 [Ascosphaera aggregata]
MLTDRKLSHDKAWSCLCSDLYRMENETKEREPQCLHQPASPERTSSKLHYSRVPRALSRLELLPAELIEKIFFHCFEPAFALASPRFTHVLSSESVYRALMILAFCDGDWEVNGGPWFGKLCRISHQTDLDIRYEQRERLQMSILKCRWFTFERLRRAQTDILCSFVRTLWLSQIGEIESDQSSAVQAFLQQFGELEPHTWTTKHFQSAKRPGKWSRLRVEYGPRLRIFTDYQTPQICFPGELKAMPESLLSGSPWTKAKIRFLDSLTTFFQLPSRMDSLNPSEFIEAPGILPHKRPNVSRDAITRGIQSAIIEGSTEALDILLKYFGETSFILDSAEVAQTFLNAWPPTTNESLVNTYIPINMISPDHFLTAARHRSNSFVMKTLIKYGSESFPGNRPEIWQYATNLKRQNDAFGDVLLDYYLA